jgi:hypothetical protein
VDHVVFPEFVVKRFRHDLKDDSGSLIIAQPTCLN